MKALRETLVLIEEVKAFGRTLGVEPSEALSQSSREKPARSMLWLWLQRLGTIALRTSLDVRLEIQFSATKEELPLEYLYLSGSYSAYFRQGNQFGDPRSVATIDFARDSMLIKVKTVLHEDMHDDRNFDLPWEDEESIITPLGALAALEFFKQKNDQANTKRALEGIEEERTLSRELVAIARTADQLFRIEAPSESREEKCSSWSAHRVVMRAGSSPISSTKTRIARWKPRSATISHTTNTTTASFRCTRIEESCERSSAISRRCLRGRPARLWKNSSQNWSGSRKFVQSSDCLA